jgi:hypothetical protein
VPDPTVLTTQALIREVDALRVEIQQQSSSLREVIETRLNGMDKAIELLQVTSDRAPTAVDAKINNLKELHGEKFLGVQRQFDERDIRANQTILDSKAAVAAALQAAKEAVGLQTEASDRAIAKSEAATTEQMKQLGVQIQTETRALNEKNDDVKDRLTRIEGRGSGYSTSWAVGMGVLVALISIAGLLIALLR